MEIKNATECVNLSEIRECIDRIDESIVRLIAKRSEYVKEAAKFKTSQRAVQDEKRVREVIESKKALALKYNISHDLVATLYQEMIHHFIQEETEVWEKLK